jgi:rhodanese-related sulfurtransferase
VVLDVREPWELAICRVEESTTVPLRQLAARIDELPHDRPIVCLCHHGTRSQHAALTLRGAGFADVYNLRGGVAAWADEVDPAMARY